MQGLGSLLAGEMLLENGSYTAAGMGSIPRGGGSKRLYADDSATRQVASLGVLILYGFTTVVPICDA